MVKVKYNSTAMRYAEEIVVGTKTIREYLEEKNAVMTAQFSVGGRILSSAELDMTLDDVYKSGMVPAGQTINLFETAKTTGAAC